MMKLGLSPMDGVTDAAMRYMTAKYSSAPVIQSSSRLLEHRNTGKLENQTGVDFLFTEFVSVDALHHATGERRERLLKTFIKARDVGPLDKKPVEIAQVFGNNPDYFKEAAELIESLGFDGIDINMGCPAHKVEEQGSGAGLIRTPDRAKEIVRAVKSATSLPVSVKTRIGVNTDIVEEWMEHLMEVQPVRIAVHGRTLRQLYSGQADWEAIGRAAKVVHKHGGIIFGNGDVGSIEQGKVLSEKYKVDGILIGRAAEGNPGIFRGLEPTVEQRLEWMVEHARIFESIFKYSSPPCLEAGTPVLQSSSEIQKYRKTGTRENDNRWFMPMRKHLAWYCKGFEGAVEMRAKLMFAKGFNDISSILN